MSLQTTTEISSCASFKDPTATSPIATSTSTSNKPSVQNQSTDSPRPDPNRLPRSAKRAKKAKPSASNQTSFGTVTSTSSTSKRTTSRSLGRSVIVCLCNGRGHCAGTVGLAAIDLNTNRLLIRQLEDSSNYYDVSVVLSALEPLELAVPRTALEARPESPLIKRLKMFFSDVKLIGIDRRWFNDCKGLEALRKFNLCAESEPRLEIELRNKYFALASVNAVIEYVQATKHAATPSSLRIDVLPVPEEICHLDSVTVRDLELVASLDSASNAHKYTLLNVINYTATGPGERALKLRLLQPLREAEDIEERLDCVTELINHIALTQDLHNLLSKTVDLDRVIPNIVKETSGEADAETTMANLVSSLLGLKHNLDLLTSFQTMLAPFANEEDSLPGQQKMSYLNVLHRCMSDQRFEQVSGLITEYFVPEISLSRGVADSLTARMGCVRAGVSDTLDEYRKLYAQALTEVEEIRRNAVQQHSMDKLQLVFSATRGFHFSLPGSIRQMALLPSEFTKITFARTHVHFTSESLLRANERISCLVNEIYLSSMIVLQPLIEQIRPDVEVFYKLADTWAELDVFCSLAILATVNAGYVRPRFDPHLTAIAQGRHPVLARDWTPDHSGTFVSNPVRLTSKDNIVILTGPNNAGKSVYMKQLALLQILAQIGSYVPAEWAVFRPACSIFSRTGSGDDLVSNCSSYKLEVVQISQVLDNVDENSLVIVDELGRGTSEEDGSALCFAIARFLAELRAFVIFSTHFELLTHLEKFCPNVSNCHIDAALEEGRIVYRRQLKDGVTPMALYGVQVARRNGLNEAICAHADEVAKILWMNSKPVREIDEAEFRLALRRQASGLRKKALMVTEGGSKALTKEQAIDFASELEQLTEAKRKLEQAILERGNDETGLGEHRIEIESSTRAGGQDSNVHLEGSVRRPHRPTSPFFRTPSSRAQETSSKSSIS